MTGGHTVGTGKAVAKGEMVLTDPAGEKVAIGPFSAMGDSAAIALTGLLTLLWEGGDVTASPSRTFFSAHCNVRP